MWPWGVAVLLLAWAAMGAWQRCKPLPEGVGQAWPERPAAQVRLLVDETWYDAQGQQHRRQAIFDEMLTMIEQARRLVVLDVFLFNDFAGATEGKEFRPLSGELAEALIAQQRRHPTLEAVVVTDPLNTFYGSLAPEHFARLRAAGVRVVITDLNRLRASNPLWSGLWHLGPRWLGNRSDGGWLPNALGPGRVTLRSYLALLNFNANHRKTLVVDHGDDWAGLVTSANPHDASSLHGNVALRFAGPAARDLLVSERWVAAWGGVKLSGPSSPEASPVEGGGPRLQLVTEGAIREALLAAIGRAGRGERLNIAVFYLSHRGLIEALVAARRRGVRVRVLLDPNQEAFGLKKGGIPNRPVADELVAAGIEVRWCLTRGEQCHGKLLLRHPVATDGEAEMILGSANFTRRNLDNLNLETSVRLVGAPDTPVIMEAMAFFRRRWDATPACASSEPYVAGHAVRGWQVLRYRIMEATGLSTF
ncbi:phospholipase D-like domain-containing protein [Halomonas cerina]|uniref:Phosphatidylserine/phosphatidylglycerophosphate/ cardiolipin synthase-like enzyme n=1 Tax=Halomonas cerina TaxID=447424 RepID=A0A839V855_9GAMM|nr:phospholipase D-like domain-containing protein [Halomonas cerina]MBB3188884.1 phosphatidylserine/phosphatidylglycerophosphate/cardiolipin synthase-like enzyme [Halomonas cerina]